MAPSVAEIEVVPITVVTKSLPERPITVKSVAVENESGVKPVALIDQVAAVETAKTAEETFGEIDASKPKIRRIINEEGKTTSASVSVKGHDGAQKLTANPVPTLPPNMGP